MTKYIKDKNGKFAGSIGEGRDTLPSGPPMPPPQRIRNKPDYESPSVVEQYEAYQRHYFAQDGNYGDADTLAVVDTSRWTNADWDEIDEAPDYDRARIARLIEMREADRDRDDNEIEEPDIQWNDDPEDDLDVNF